jgi:hypothetical protein
MKIVFQDSLSASKVFHRENLMQRKYYCLINLRVPKSWPDAVDMLIKYIPAG